MLNFNILDKRVEVIQTEMFSEVTAKQISVCNCRPWIALAVCARITRVPVRCLWTLPFDGAGALITAKSNNSPPPLLNASFFVPRSGDWDQAGGGGRVPKLVLPAAAPAWN